MNNSNKKPCPNLRCKSGRVFSDFRIAWHDCPTCHGTGIDPAQETESFERTLNILTSGKKPDFSDSVPVPETNLDKQQRAGEKEKTHPTEASDCSTSGGHGEQLRATHAPSNKGDALVVDGSTPSLSTNLAERPVSSDMPKALTHEARGSSAPFAHKLFNLNKEKPMNNLYTKRPVTVEARRCDDTTTPAAIADWCGGKACGVGDLSQKQWIEIPTLEGVMRADYGDWIIKGVHGEFYPCKPDIFAETYSPALSNSKEVMCHAEREIWRDDSPEVPSSGQPLNDPVLNDLDEYHFPIPSEKPLEEGQAADRRGLDTHAQEIADFIAQEDVAPITSGQALVGSLFQKGEDFIHDVLVENLSEDQINLLAQAAVKEKDEEIKELRSILDDERTSNYSVVAAKQSKEIREAKKRIEALEEVLFRLAYPEETGVNNLAGDPSRWTCQIAYKALGGIIKNGKRLWETSQELRNAIYAPRNNRKEKINEKLR